MKDNPGIGTAHRTPTRPPSHDRPVCASSPQLSTSLLECQAITRQAHSSFPIAFRLLPAAKRRAMLALYAFMRVTDDLADEPGDVATKHAQLVEWRTALLAALEGEYTHPIHAALATTLHRYAIPPRYLLDVIDGVQADLAPLHFATFTELYPYCYRVASAVGLACIPIWGFQPGVTAADAHEAAEAAGIAFQLTNILRDLGEDLARGRVYLPSDELERFDSAPGTWHDPAATPQFEALLQFQIDRARSYYRKAASLTSMLSHDGRAIFPVMCNLYQQLLEEVGRGGAEVLRRRVRVPRWRKSLILMNGWMAKWGWA